ncbi:MAG: T9SS type A sorting domain-containing protein [Pseudarcicella sp.]|nr:T9SS type A sorting domain-containing protein [Pseudarcicella sp.]
MSYVASAQLSTFEYPVATGEAFLSDKYDVFVKVGTQPEQKLQVLMSDANYRTLYEGDFKSNELRGRTFSFVHIDYDTSGAGLKFRVVKKFGTGATNVDISPKSYGYTPTIAGNEMSFTMDQNSKYISVNFKTADNLTGFDKWIKHMLCIFVDPPEKNKPSITATGVVEYSPTVTAAKLASASIIYFSKGFHNLKNYTDTSAVGSPISKRGILTLKTNQSVYLEGGAFLEGIIARVSRDDVNQKVYGRGILTGRKFYWSSHPQFAANEPSELSNVIELGKNATVSGIMYMESPNHGLVGGKMLVENVKFLGWHSNNDGVRIGQGSEVRNSFLRSVDDHFYNFGNYIHDCVLWAGHNGAILTYGWGGDVGDKTYTTGGTRMDNIDIINPEWVGLGNNNGIIMSQVGYDFSPGKQGTPSTLTSIKNMRIEGKIPGLINLKPRSGGLTGANVAIKVPASTVGYVGDLLLENISVESQYTKGLIRGEANPSIEGTSGKWLIKNVQIKNVTIGGVCMTNDNLEFFNNVDRNTMENFTFECRESIKDLTAISDTCTRAKLKWTDATTETGYKIARRLSPSTIFTTIATLPANTVQYIDNTLTPNSRFEYMITFQNSTGVSSDMSNVVAVQTSNCVILPTLVIQNLLQNEEVVSDRKITAIAKDSTSGIKNVKFELYKASNMTTAIETSVVQAEPYEFNLVANNLPNDNYVLRVLAVSNDLNETKMLSRDFKIKVNRILANEPQMSRRKVFVYPNPLEKTAKIYGINEKTTWELMDFSGKKILAGKGSQIDFSSNANGNYLLKVTGKTIKVSVKSK